MSARLEASADELRGGLVNAVISGRLATGLLITFAAGCSGAHYVVAATGTVIGVEVSENPQTQLPHAKLGYNRAELALVPTDRTGDDDLHYPTGSRNTANVLMELRYGGIFDIGKSSAIYQRLAVGDIAVAQPGASLMFVRNGEGDIDKDSAAAAIAAVTSATAPLNTKGLSPRALAQTFKAMIATLDELKALEAGAASLRKRLDDSSGPVLPSSYIHYGATEDPAVVESSERSITGRDAPALVSYFLALEECERNLANMRKASTEGKKPKLKKIKAEPVTLSEGDLRQLEATVKAELSRVRTSLESDPAFVEGMRYVYERQQPQKN
jgi:hypothetical protein